MSERPAAGRRLLLAADGTLRAPWRIIGFLAATAAFVAVLGPLTGVLFGEQSLASLSVFSWLILVALVGAHAVMLRFVDRAPWSAVGLGPEHAAPSLLARGWLLGALAIGLPSLALLATGWLAAEPMPGGGAEWWRFALSMTLFLLPAALWEELAFRGYAFAVLRRAIGAPATLVVTSVLFGAAHTSNLPSVGLMPLVLVAFAGVLLGGVVLATGSVYAAWMAHFAWNWVMAVLLHTDVSGIMPGSPPAYRVVDAGPDWATGGAWGPEGGLPAGLGMAAGVAYLFARHRRRGEA